MQKITVQRIPFINGVRRWEGHGRIPGRCSQQIKGVSISKTDLTSSEGRGHEKEGMEEGGRGAQRNAKKEKRKR